MADSEHVAKFGQVSFGDLHVNGENATEGGSKLTLQSQSFVDQRSLYFETM